MWRAEAALETAKPDNSRIIDGSGTARFRPAGTENRA